MAAAKPPGGSSPAGGAGAVDGEEGGCGESSKHGGADMAVLGAEGCCGSSNPVAAQPRSSEMGAAASVAAIWKEDPTQSSRWNAGMDLDDEAWDVRFNLDGKDNLERCLGKSDITYLNLLALIEGEGYGINDSMYFVKENGRGIAGMELLDGMKKVEQMIKLYESKKSISLTVIRGGTTLALDTNIEAVEEQHIFSDHGNSVVYTVDNDGVVLPIQEDDNSEFETYLGETESDDGELGDTLREMRKKNKKVASTQDCEYEVEAEDLYVDFDCSDSDTDCEVVPEPVAAKKKKEPRGKGPTTRAHCSQQSTTPADYVPSDDEGPDGDLDPLDDDGFEVMKWALPRGRKSRANKREARVWYDESRLQPEQGLCLKMCFVDVYQFRRAVQTLHIAQLRNFRYHRNCKDRVIVKCKEKDCPFFMVGSQVGREKTMCLRKMNIDHTCGPVGEHCKITGKWVAKICEPSIRIDLRTGVEAVQETTKERYGVDVPKMMAYRAKRRAVSVVLGDQVEQYRRLRDYLQTVLDTNPGSRCIVTTKELVEHPSPNPRFHGMFYCLGASIQGFLNGCRPFVGLDGCFVKLTTGQQILCATGRDGNNNIFPIAFGLVDKEETSTWSWFLTQLKYALGGETGKFGHYTIISDRQKGLLNAINQFFPNCPQRYCLRHIYANFQTAGFRGEELQKYIYAGSYSFTQHGFDVAMANLKEESEEAWEWLMKIPVSTWARYAMDCNCKTDLVVNNLSEVFNRMILDVRGKPVRTMVDGIRKKIMVRNDEKRTGAAKSKWEITPTYVELLEENKKWSRLYRSRRAVDGLWEVSRNVDKSYAVNLSARTCDCRRWDMTGIPCAHAISAIYKSFQKPEDFVPAFFKKEMYLEAYNPVVYPVPGEELWTKTNTPDIDPPVLRVNLGRVQTKRRKGKFEPPQPKSTSRMATITCSNCGTLGHRYTNCGVPLKPSLAIRKNQHQENREGEGSEYAAPSAPATTPPVAPAATPPTPPVAPSPSTTASHVAPSSARPAALRKNTSTAAAPAARPTAPAARPAAPAAGPSPCAPSQPAAKKRKATTSATPRPAAPKQFNPPRPAATGPSEIGPSGRPVRKKKKGSRIQGYFTASNIDNLTLADIKKGL